MAYMDKGGAGGKFREKPVRRSQATPYDRPQLAIRSNGGGWISKIVDPASKLISSCSHSFFESVFRKRLANANNPTQDANQESRNKLQKAITTDAHVAQEAYIVNGFKVSNIPDGGSIAELEEVLKQKTFTRSEIDHLTELLHARTLDFPAGDTVNRPEANDLKSVTAKDRRDKFPDVALQESGVAKHRLPERTTTPVVSSKVFVEDVASPADITSPADIAKAYMCNRPSIVSPSVLDIQSQSFREDAFLHSPTFPPKSSMVLSVPKSSTHGRLSDNGFMTPRSCRRSAIYNMARTPYFKTLPGNSNKSASSTICGYGNLLSSPSTLEQNGRSEYRQILKRRNLVLDDDGSVGPVRRLRQKSNLSLANHVTLPVSGTPTSTRLSLSWTDRPLLLDKPKHNISNALSEDTNKNIPSSSFISGHSQSSQTAARILQQLDKLTSPLKIKSSELKLDAAKENSLNMSKVVESVQDKKDSLFNTPVHDVHISSQNWDRFEENGPLKLVGSHENAALVTDRLNTTISTAENLPVKLSGDVITNDVVNSLQKKIGFQMSAYEDVNIEKDSYTNEATPNRVKKLNASVYEIKGFEPAPFQVEKSRVFSENKPITNVILGDTTDLKASDTSDFSKKNVSFKIPDTVHNQIVQSNSSTPNFLVSELTSKSSLMPPMTSNTSGSSNPKVNTSCAFNSNVATETDQKPDMEKVNDEEQKNEELFSKQNSTPPFIGSTSATTILNGTIGNMRNLNNGSVSSSPVFPNLGPPIFNNTPPSAFQLTEASSSKAKSMHDRTFPTQSTNSNFSDPPAMPNDGNKIFEFAKSAPSSTSNNMPQSNPFLFVSSSASTSFNSSGTQFGFTNSTIALNPNPFSFSVGTDTTVATASSTLISCITPLSSPNTFGFTTDTTMNTSNNYSLDANGQQATTFLPPFQPVNPNPVFAFGSSGNNDQMNMEESMGDDNVQVQQPFGQTVPGFTFSSGAPVFQLSVQTNQTIPVTPNPFQASGSLDFSTGGSFSLGSNGGGADKSNRKIIKAKRKLRK